MVIVREFDAKKDLRAVEEVERNCEIGPSGKISLFTDLLGDPICRVRHSPAYLMLVATIIFLIKRNFISFFSYFIKKGNFESLIQVAEMVVSESQENERTEIVGMIRGCIKTVTCGKKLSRNGKNLKPLPVYTKLAYILGLRVAPPYRYHIFSLI